jgi:hypothetical protein
MVAAALWSSMMRWPGHREGELQMEIGVAECGGAGRPFYTVGEVAEGRSSGG